MRDEPEEKGKKQESADSELPSSARYFGSLTATGVHRGATTWTCVTVKRRNKKAFIDPRVGETAPQAKAIELREGGLTFGPVREEQTRRVWEGT